MEIKLAVIGLVLAIVGAAIVLAVGNNRKGDCWDEYKELFI